MQQATEAGSQRAAPRLGLACYAFGVLFPLLYLLFVRRERQEPFVRFHCFQCLILFALLTPLHFADFGRLNQVSEWAFFLLVVGWFVAMIQAGRGKTLRLPLIGHLAGRLV
jgi:uncharacterized membrane protein